MITRIYADYRKACYESSALIRVICGYLFKYTQMVPGTLKIPGILRMVQGCHHLGMPEVHRTRRFRGIGNYFRFSMVSLDRPVAAAIFSIGTPRALSFRAVSRRPSALPSTIPSALPSAKPSAWPCSRA